jgi:hypothetical protein
MENQSNNWRTKTVLPSNKDLKLRAGEGRYGLSCCLPRDQNYDRIAAQQETQEQQMVRVRQELRSLPIFADDSGETYNLFPLEEPVDLGMKSIGNCLPQRITRFAASVYDPAEIRFVNADQLGKPILPYPCFVNRELQVWVN